MNKNDKDKLLPTHFELMTETEREAKIDEMNVLDEELKTLRKNARVYQKQGNTNVFFLEAGVRVHSETKLVINNITTVHNRLKKQQ